jgi:hypothetical protein
MIIYKTINTVNNKEYIGRDKHNNPRYLGSGTVLKQAIKKYGRKNFKKSILEETEDTSREQYWILYYNTIYPKGYNLTIGGDGGDTFTALPEDRKKSKIKLLKSIAKQKTKNGIGIASKSKKGNHITISCPEIKETWDRNFKISMEKCRERHKLGILTEREKIGLVKKKKFWKSKEERIRRSNRQSGTLNSNYKGPYAVYDENSKILKEFIFLNDVLYYVKESGYGISLAKLIYNIKNKIKFSIGKLDGCMIYYVNKDII